MPTPPMDTQGTDVFDTIAGAHTIVTAPPLCTEAVLPPSSKGDAALRRAKLVEAFRSRRDESTSTKRKPRNRTTKLPPSTLGQRQRVPTSAKAAAIFGAKEGFGHPDGDVLQFSIYSTDKPVGRGAGERVSTPKAYAGLAAVKGWRLMFSDVWVEDIEVGGVRYRTHQHALQAGKFLAAGLPDVAARFSADSGDLIGTGDGSTAYSARRAANLTDEQVAAWNTARGAWKDQIYSAKFHEGSRATIALCATADALLIFDEPGGRGLAVRLMQRRAALRGGVPRAGP
eukprot:m.49416 g.49416  ORF g.49416 m.49416 type:complete len:285 (-) comp16104_c0_seq1:381-1235(-)